MNAICTEDEILRLEHENGLILPNAYKNFLRAGHQDFQREMVGSDFQPPQLFELQKWGRELLEENSNPFILGKNDFVFLMHQGYQFFYFSTASGSDDPPVYYYMEGNELPTKVAGRFSFWLERMVNSK